MLKNSILRNLDSKSFLETNFFIPISFMFFAVVIVLYVLNFFKLIDVDSLLNLPVTIFVSCVFFIIYSVKYIKYFPQSKIDNFIKLLSILQFCIITSSTILLSLSTILNSLYSNNFFTFFLNIHLTLLLMLIAANFLFQKRRILNELKNNEISKNDKESKFIILLIVLLVIASFFIRYYKLDYLTPVTDEFYHLLAAKRLLLNGFFEYKRASFLSLIIGLLFKIHNSTSILLARLPGVLVGSLTVIPMYFFAKKIHTKIGIISGILLTTLPVAVGISRYIREYVFYFFIIVVFLLWLDKIMKNIFLKKKLKASVFCLICVLLLPALYYFFIEDSTFVIQLYFILILFILTFVVYENALITINSNYLKNFLTKKNFIILLSVFIFFFFLTKKVVWLIKIKTPFSFFAFDNLNYFDALFNPNFNSWNTKLFWFSNSHLPTFFIFSLFILSLLYLYKNRYFIFCILSLASVFIPLQYLSGRYYAIRYIFYGLIFYIVMFSCSIYLLFLFKNIYKNRTVRVSYIIITLIFLLFVFQISPLINGLKNEKIGEADPKKELLGYNYPNLFTKLEELHFNDGDFLISSDGVSNALAYYFKNYPYIEDKTKYPLMRFEYLKKGDALIDLFDMTTIYSYYYTTPYNRPCYDEVCNIPEADRISKIIAQNKTGWIIIDKDRNRNWNSDGFPVENFVSGNKLILYRGSVDGYRGFDIYSW